MLFGGQLTSILVCQKCKHVSQTYEDFNDLSLSIKAEDYAKKRKRDRLKKLARKMGMGGGKAKRTVSVTEPQSDLVISSPSASSEHRLQEPNLDIQKPPESNIPGSTGMRASSVPPTPNTGGIVEHEPIFSPDGSRRRSLDGLTNGSTDAATVTDDEDEAVVIDIIDADGPYSPEKPLATPPGLGPTTPDEKRIEFAQVPKVERSDKGKDKDGWARIGRRISMTVGIKKSSNTLSKDKAKEKEKEKEEERTSRSRSRTGVDMTRLSLERARSPADSAQPEIRLSRPSVSPERPHSTPPMFLKRALTSQDVTTPKRSKSKSRPQSLTRSSTPILNVVPDNESTPRLPFVQRSKSPRPPKPSKAEEEYLRAILADVNTTPVSGANPFDFFSNWHHSSSEDNHASSSSTPISSPAGTIPPSPGSAWLAKLGQLPLAGVEECLRMFTSVEVLDGENMVGCRRCWKLANGWYEDRDKRDEGKLSRGKIKEEEEEEDGDDSEEDERERHSGNEEFGNQRLTVSPPLSRSQISSFSSPTLALYAHENPSDAFSVVSSPPNVAGTVNSKSRPPSFVSELTSDQGIPSPSQAVLSDADEYQSTSSPEVSPAPPIPSICTTTEIDVESSMLTARPDDLGFPASASMTGISVESKDSLLSVPPLGQHLESDTNTSASSVTDYSSDGGESDTTSVSTATSALVSGQSVDSLVESSTTDPSTPSAMSYLMNGSGSPVHPSSNAPSSSVQQQSQPSPAKQKKPKPPKPVIMRPAYKRYLVATPPPILVIHLKRFQQINKNPIMSFSSGFKKLEDYVAFPEYFDLTPFLAPKKEDFGLGKRGKGDSSEDSVKSKEGNKERCLYRLYAVVVHIGNMVSLGYIPRLRRLLKHVFLKAWRALHLVYCFTQSIGYTSSS